MRGTKGASDFVVDQDNKLTPYTAPGASNCTSCTVHTGFQKAWAGVADSVLSTVADSVKKYPGHQIVVTGHSLGGATTSLVAIALAQVYGSGFGGGKVIAYSLASPRTGNPGYAKHLSSLFPKLGTYYRITSTNDGVPQDLTIAEGYHHAGNEYWIQKEPPSTGAIITTCNGEEDPECNARFGKSKSAMGINAVSLVD
jgi:feruloyl esterase